MIKLKQLIEVSTISVKTKDITFSAHPGKSGIILLAKSSKDLDKLRELDGDMEIQKELLQIIQNKTKIDFYNDWSWEGAGFHFKIDLYKLAKKIK